MKFNLPSEFVDKDAIQIHIVGAGGTGSAVLGALRKLALVAKEVGMPAFDCVVWDDDLVSAANIGRQEFAKADIGRNKARVLVNRINLSFGLNWQAQPERFTPLRRYMRSHFVIGCVDSRAARADLQAHFYDQASVVWIDCGNSRASGQVVMGVRHRRQTLLPSAADLFPEVADKSEPEDDQPSCSVAEAIARQDPMINQLVAAQAANLLWRTLRFGGVDAHGAFISAEGMTVSPMPVDELYWRSMGWQAKPDLLAA